MQSVMMPQVKYLLLESVTEILVGKGISTEISTKVAQQVVDSFDNKVSEYLNDLITNQQLEIIQEAIKLQN